VEYHFMLPGLRFLFVAIVLSVSMMIFGLGAAALLRSAQQEVASLPTRHVQPETIFAQQTETTTPTLAMLSVDARVPQQNGIDRPAVADMPSPAPPQMRPAPNASIEPNQMAAEPDRSTAQTAALPSEEKSGSSDKASGAPVRTETKAGSEVPAPLPEKPELETQRRETPAADSPAPAAPAAVATTAAPAEMTTAPIAATTAPVEMTSAPVGTTVAPVGTAAAAPATTAPETTAAVPATAATAPAAAAPAAAAPATVSAPSDDGAKSAAAKIATLGTLSAPVEPQAASKTSVSTAGKRAQARHVAKRRRIARARLMVQRPAGQPATAQPAPAPFFMTGQPGS
jgi:hypothetical protein